jgi:TolA-binding protein
MSKLYDFVSVKGTAENINILKTALSEAETAVSPYWAEQLRIAQGSLVEALEGLGTDYNYQTTQLQNNITRINEDLTTRRGELSLDQQAELLKQKENYTQQLESVQNTAASQGLTFSSNRNTAENRLYGTYYNPQYGIMESTNRTYQRQIAALETEAARGNVDAQNQLANLKAKTGQSATNTVRTAEQYLGSSNLPSLPQLNGIAPQTYGNISGDFARNRETDIWNLASRKAQLLNPFL